MTSENSRQNYLRASREEFSPGVESGARPETTLEEARTELAKALSGIGKSMLKDRYGPLVGVVSEQALIGALKNLESNLANAKGDITILLEEILDRLFPSSPKDKSIQG